MPQSTAKTVCLLFLINVTVAGAEAKDWKMSRPIRVVRTYKMSERDAEHGKYAPKLGMRYDGIYKIVKYWPEKSKSSGFLVWVSGHFIFLIVVAISISTRRRITGAMDG
jgi:hypothetical protein